MTSRKCKFAKTEKWENSNCKFADQKSGKLQICKSEKSKNCKFTNQKRPKLQVCKSEKGKNCKFANQNCEKVKTANTSTQHVFKIFRAAPPPPPLTAFVVMTRDLVELETDREQLTKEKSRQFLSRFLSVDFPGRIPRIFHSIVFGLCKYHVIVRNGLAIRWSVGVATCRQFVVETLSLIFTFTRWQNNYSVSSLEQNVFIKYW